MLLKVEKLVKMYKIPILGGGEGIELPSLSRYSEVCCDWKECNVSTQLGWNGNSR